MRDGSTAPGGFEPYCTVSRARSGVARVNPLVRVWTESATHTPTTPSMADAHQAMTWAHNFGTPWSGHEASTLDSNASCPRLRVVAPRVFLFSFVYGGDPVMMHHFCHHYFERVGVPADAGKVCLTSTPQCDAAQPDARRARRCRSACAEYQHSARALQRCGKVARN